MPEDTDTLLEETLKVTGGEPGDPNLPKPSDMEKEELKPSPSVPPKPSVKEEEPPDETLIDQLQGKLNKGEELTDAEQELLAQIAASEVVEEPVAEEKTYNIGGRLLKQSEVDQQMREEYGLGDIKLSEKTREKMIDNYVKAQNRSEASRKISQEQQENARQRRDNFAERYRLQAEQNNIKRERERLAKERQAMKAILELKSIEIQEDETTGRTDSKKIVEAAKIEAQKGFAESRLIEIDEQEKTVEAQDQRLRREYTEKELSAFLTAHPQYKTTEDINLVFDKIQRGEPVNADDELKVQELIDLFELHATRQMTLEKVYELQAKRNMLAFPDKAAQASNSQKLPLPEPSSKNKSMTEIIERYKKRMKSAPASIGEGGGGEPPQKSLSRQIVEHDRKIAGLENKGNPYLKELGF